MPGHTISRFRLLKPMPLVERHTLTPAREHKRKETTMVRRLSTSIISAIAFFAMLMPLAGVNAQQAIPKGQSYTVLSVTPSEVLLLVQPTYRTQVVKDPNGHSFTEITFPGGFTTDSVGAQEIQRLNLAFLAPSKRQATVEIVNQKLDVLPGIDLAPVPTYKKNSNGDIMEQYIVHAGRYNTTQSSELFSVSPVGNFRTAFSERIMISPVQYDAESRTVTRMRSLTLRIRFSDASEFASMENSGNVAPKISDQEADFFRGIFVNGSVADFYSLASSATPALYPKSASMPMSVASSPVIGTGTGQWLQLQTGDEGIYRVTAQDLANAGITGTVDPSSIELFGIGGEILNELPTDSSGEWLERPVEIKTDANQNFTELYFYASGLTVWQYSNDLSGTDGLFHVLNPYTSVGHFFLKIGGARLGNGLRVSMNMDSLLSTPLQSSKVVTAVNHEIDSRLEYVNSDYGREMLDQNIPRQDAGTFQFTVDAPGYTGDATIVRVAHDSQIASDSAGFISVQVNGQNVQTINSRAEYSSTGNEISRNWDHTFVLDQSIQAPLNFGLSFTSTDPTGLAWLDFVEMVYMRGTDIGSQSIPFMLIDTNAALQYNFTSAGGGQVWDVTNSVAPKIVDTAIGNGITADLQGQSRAMRRFFAFTPSSALAPSISPVSVPTLRTSVCLAGATEIIVAPRAFIVQADSLALLRAEGGQATEAMSAQAVAIEDIYQEFGYGSSDPMAIRDFMAYTLRHAAPGSKPVYLTLLGGGHCDYQNRQTPPNSDFVPVWENIFSGPIGYNYPATFRNSPPQPYPDDWIYGQLSPANANTLYYDVAVGRVSARDVADAETFVGKVQHYEHASDTGSWRSLGTFLADDRYDPEFPEGIDELNHLGDTEGEETHLQDRVLVHKIYEVTYPSIFSSTGQRLKPTCNTDILSAINTGTVLFSFVGHGNPNVWTHESILNVPSSIDEMTNYDHLAYLTTATCDFSEYDDFTIFSGGEQFLMNPIGGAIGLLGTSRSVGGSEPLVQNFYQDLFQNVGDHGTATVGMALLASKPTGQDPYFFYLLGDPAQRLLLPKSFVTFDSINGGALGAALQNIAALSQVRISGSIRPDTDAASQADNTFNGNITVTLYDTPTLVSATTTFPTETINDSFLIDGPILYRGSATVTNGHFSISFIVPRDIKLDSGAAKLAGYAYAEDSRTALGVTTNIHLAGSGGVANVIDTTGPSLAVYLGSRAFRSGDIVSCNSTAIVDVDDIFGLNTSTASIGHSFIAWVDEAEDSAIDLASTYVSKENDYTSGTSQQAITLPAGEHTLHVRAFDTYDNATFASVDFIAMNAAPYQLYQVGVVPDPILDHTTFSFVQPGNAGSLVNVTLTIYTTDGRPVRTLTAQTRESTVDIPWDARDESGMSVADGIYFFNIKADLGGGTSSQASGKCIVAN